MKRLKDRPTNKCYYTRPPTCCCKITYSRMLINSWYNLDRRRLPLSAWESQMACIHQKKLKTKVVLFIYMETSFKYIMYLTSHSIL